MTNSAPPFTPHLVDDGWPRASSALTDDRDLTDFDDADSERTDVDVGAPEMPVDADGDGRHDPRM